jgi:steroid delta-isomerase-like uncharacterized protein
VIDVTSKTPSERTGRDVLTLAPSSEFIHDWSRRYLNAWNAHQPEGVAELCTEDIVWDDPSLPEPGRGREAVCTFVAETVQMFPDLHVTETLPPLISPGGEIVLSRYELTGTMRGRWAATGFAPTGAQVRLRGVDQWTFTGDAMSHYTSYYDSLDVGRQLGIIPPMGSPSERAMVALQQIAAWFMRRRRRPSVT